MAENLQRRQFSRVNVSLPARFTVEGNGNAESHDGSIIVLGEGGVRLVSSAHAPASSTVQVHFKVPTSDRDIRAYGHVVLSFYSATEDKYHHGIAFTSVESPDRETISAYVESLTARR
jgi:c-di-GMP-binding flagellar brake protein YcgR